MVNAGPGREAVFGDGPLGGDEQRRGAVGHLRGDPGREPAALDDGLEAGHLLQRGVAARPLVHGHLSVRDGLPGEAALVDGAQGPLVRAEREVLHVLAGDAPLLRDEFGAMELVDRCVAVAGAPALGAGVRAVGQSQGFGGLAAGVGDGDHRHVLGAARDDQVLGAGHHALGGEMDGLLGGAALPVDGGAGHLLGEARGEPGGAGDVPGLRADRVQAAEDDVLHRGRVDAAAFDQRLDDVGPEVGGVDGGESALAPADRGAYRFDDVGLGHDCSFVGGMSGGVRCSW